MTINLDFRRLNSNWIRELPNCFPRSPLVMPILNLSRICFRSFPLIRCRKTNTIFIFNLNYFYVTGNERYRIYEEITCVNVPDLIFYFRNSILSDFSPPKVPNYTSSLFYFLRRYHQSKCLRSHNRSVDEIST